MTHILLHRLLLPVALLAFQTASLAHEGHDHSEPPAATTHAAPRFAASSERFELVGVVEGRALNLYLDAADTNTPITAAHIELEIAGAKLNATEKPDGLYTVSLPAELKEGTLPIMATLTVGDEIDLVAGELEIAHDDDHPTPAPRPGNRLWLAAAALAALLAGITLYLKRRGGAA
jgi:hypothetical protein